MVIFIYFLILILFICCFGLNKPNGRQSRGLYLTIIILLSTLLRFGLLIYTFNDNVYWINDCGNVPYIEGDFSTYRRIVTYLLDSYYEGAIPSPLYIQNNFGANGIYFSYFLSIPIYLFSDYRNLLDGILFVPLSHFFLNIFRIILSYKLSYNLFNDYRVSRLAAVITAFFPSVVYWDFLTYKESFLMTVQLLGHYYLSCIYISKSTKNTISYLMIMIIIIHIMFLDRIYFGVMFIFATYSVFIFKNARRLRSILFSRNAIIPLIIFLAIFTTYIVPQFGFIEPTRAAIGDASTIGITKGTLAGFIRIILTPNPWNTTIHNSLSCLIMYGATIHAFLVFYFFIGIMAILKNNWRRSWILVSIFIFFILFACVNTGAHRQRDNFVPIMAIVASYGYFRIKWRQKVMLARNERQLQLRLSDK